MIDEESLSLDAPFARRESAPRATSISRTGDVARPWSQPLGASELLFVRMRRFTPTNVIRAVSLQGTVDPVALRAALDALRDRHPMLRTLVVDGESPRFVHDAAPPVPIFVHGRENDAHVHALVRTLMRTPIPHEPGPLFQVHLLLDASTQSSELVVVGDHALCDGISMNALTAEIVETLAGASVAPPRPTRPVVEAMLPPADGWTRVASMAAALGRFARAGIVRRLVEPRRLGYSSSHVHVELDRETTEALVHRARRERTTVTGALLAAAALTVESRSRLASPASISIPINLRSRLASAALLPDDLGNYTNATYLCAASEGGAWARARILKRQLDEAMEDDASVISMPIVFRAAGRMLKERRPPLAHVMMSNTGTVPLRSRYGDLHVKSFLSATSAPMLTADFAFFCNTFDGRLFINLVHADELVTTDEARRVITEVAALLVEMSR